MEKLVSSKHLEGVNDLTLTAPIKQGFVPALDNVTYESRLRLTMKALFRMRSTAREYAKIKPFVETAERIQALLDFRLAILDDTEPRRLLLSATFDRPFEPYIRLIWDPLGSLLDIVFCNCEGYPAAEDNSFDTYLAWVRKSQIDSDFFYAASNHSVVDVQYLSQIERLHREGREPNIEIANAAMVATRPGDLSAAVRKANPADTLELGIEALVALYRLADFYPPDRPDQGKYLQRAARDLLADWDTSALPPAVKKKFEAQLAWLKGAASGRPPQVERLTYRPEIIQGGILSNYGGEEQPVSHGAMLLMRVKDAEAARRFVGALRVHQEGAPAADGEVYVNIAFTASGLANLGVPDDALRAFPQEFREGMEARAGLLGDVGDAHPRRWNLPPRNWPAPPAGAKLPPIEMCDVDVVVQLRVASDYRGHEIVGDDDHPLAAKVRELAAQAEPGLELLSVQSMRRASMDVMPGGVGRDHFGFVDGLSQPHIRPGAPAEDKDNVARGELLRGYCNDRKDPPQAPCDYLDNGTFMVVRKLSQNVKGLRALLDEQVAKLQPKFPNMCPETLRAELMGKMMGRRPNGDPLLPGTSAASNAFDYASDPRGEKCPYQSHIRRTNPREPAHGRPSPRILRRGLSYGPSFGDDPDAERGVMFLAYNASIAEQFEVIQNWISGGNSTGVASCQGDPLMGVARDGDPRTYRFRMDGEMIRIDLPEPLVRLQWGLYLFVPSLEALKTIAEAPPAWGAGEAERGRDIIERLQALPEREAALAWKTCIEDFSQRDPAEHGDGPAVWAAIRKYHDGALRVPYGDLTRAPADAEVEEVVLAASKDLVDRVYREDDIYSVCGYLPRMADSIGEIYLGLDDGPEYQDVAPGPNSVLMAATEEQAFAVAYGAGRAQIRGHIATYKKGFGRDYAKVDIPGDYITPVLAQVCRHWFGIPDEPATPFGQPRAPTAGFHVLEGGWSWLPLPRQPHCPGDFMSPSRSIFYPDPGSEVRRHGAAHGQALRAAVRDLFAGMKAKDVEPAAPLSQKMFRQLEDPDDLARVVVGAMMGFLPPADGNLRGTLYDWIEDQTLWRVQRALPPAPVQPTYQWAAGALLDPFIRAMQKRPAPDAVWRTAKKMDELGPLTVLAGERIHVGIVSATAELAEKGERCVYPVFGGDRREENHPTHACPGYRFAMGTMIGMLAALLEAGRIQVLPAPLIVTIS